MIRLISPVLLAWTLIALSGCSLVYPLEKQGRGHVDNFVYALRWMQFNAAAAYMEPELREGFLDLFADIRDLTVTDVRPAEVTVSPRSGQKGGGLPDRHPLPRFSLIGGVPPATVAGASDGAEETLFRNRCSSLGFGRQFP